MSYRARLTCLALLLLLSGCAVPATVRRESPAPPPPTPRPPAPEAPVVVKPAPPARDTFAAFPEAFRAKARSEERQGDLRTALLQWRVVRAFLPKDPEAAGRVTALEREIRSKADGHMRKGKEQYREGKYEEARKEFLAALAYDPFLEEAADYLKRKLARQESLTYVTKEGDTPKSVAREIYKDPGKDFLVTYFSSLDAGAPLRPGTRLNLPLLDIPVAGAARSTSRANRANAPVPSFAPPPAPPASPAPTRAPAGPAYADNPLETARASFRAGEYKKAAASAEEALAKSPASREARELRNAAYYQLGTEYLRRQEYPDSLRMFRKVDPSYKDQKEMVSRAESRIREEAEGRYAAGLKLFLAEDLEAAVKEWETTLKLYPEHPTVKKDLEKARRLLEQVRLNQ